MRVRITLVVGIVVLLGACSTLVTPQSIAASGAPPETRLRAVALFEEAVELANTFLASEQRRSLPAGRYEASEDGSLVFITDARRWPIRIYHSFGGDLVVSNGFRAQERDDGFVIGVRPPAEHVETDNSMFRLTSGEWHDAKSIASLILHETAHTVHGEGTVGYWNSLRYYAEAIFLLRSLSHSAERIPQAVSMEFAFHSMIESYRRSGNDMALQLTLENFEERVAARKGDGEIGSE